MSSINTNTGANSTSATPLQNIGGLASGLDTNSIVNSLLAIDRLPETALQQRTTVETARQTLLSQIKTQMVSLQTASWALRDVGVWGDTQSVTTTDTANLSAVRTGGAAAGGYQIQVTQLARADQLRQTGTLQAAASDDVLHIAVGGGTPLDIAVTAGDALTTIAGKISGAAGSSVYASVVDGKLVVSGKTTGAANTIALTSDGGLAGSLGMTESVTARDATYTLDGVAQPPSASNVVTSALSGVTLTFQGVMTAPATVNVGAPAPDTTKITAAISKFVDTYNATVDMVSGALNEKKVARPQSDADRVAGVLNSDPQLAGLMSSLRQTMSAVMSDLPAGMTTLGSAGLSTGAAVGSGTLSQDSLAGKLTLDSARLSAALTSSFSSVKALFNQTGDSPGLAQRLDTLLLPQVRIGGVFDGRVASEGSTISDLGKQFTAIEMRVTLHEQQLRAQFTAMETAMSQSQSIMSQLSGQIAQLG